MHQVAERDDTVQRLRRSEASFQALVEAVQDYAIFRLDLLGRVATWNSGARRMSGYTAAEILGEHVRRFFTREDDDAGRPQEHLRLAAQAGRIQYQGWRVRKDGSRFWANVVIMALRDESGRLQGYAKVTQDISELKQAEDALRLREQLLDAFFSTSPVGLAILDRDLRFQRVNRTLAAINGIAADEHLGRTVRAVIPQLAPQIEPLVQEALLTGQAVLNREICGPVPGQEGVLGYWVANYFPIRSEAGEVVQVGIVVMDITDCRKAEQSLQRLSGRLMELQDQERRRIARELHDSVGQCLTAVKINLEVVGRELASARLSDAAQKALAEASVLADQCSSDTRTISHLLHPPLLDESGLSSAVRWYADGFATRCGIALSLDLPDGIRLPQQVETTLFRIVQECLTNIHRHSESSTAAIRLQMGAENVTLEVRDQGQGMPANQLKRCKGAAGVVGVGIAGMRERVRQLGGRLEIDSGPKGTLVRAVLPLGGGQ
jgi:PAS domain S-box-containing protein